MRLSERRGIAMCGRYTVDAHPDAVRVRFEVPETTLLDLLDGRYNVAPTQTVPAIRPAAASFGDGSPTAVGGWGHGRELVALAWGFIPSWSKSSKVDFSNINARDDKIEESRVYKPAFRKRRCILPATGFYEWAPGQGVKGPKVPWHFRLADGELFGFAGIWERWTPKDRGEPIESCALMTTSPNVLVEPIHGRMPAILRPEHYAEWLDPETPTARLRDLLAPYPAGDMEAWPVSPYVNSPLHQGERCLRPVA